MTDQDIIKAFVARGLLGESVAQQALREAVMSGGRAEEELYEKKVLDEVKAAQVKAELLRVPYKKVDVASIPETLFHLIPRETSITYRVMPIERQGNLLVVGMLHPDDERAQEALKFIAKTNNVSLGVYLITPSDLALAWRRYAPYRTEVEAAVKEISPLLKGGERAISLEEGGKDVEAPVIKIVASTLREAVEIGASDVHIEPQRSHLRIRFRVDGELHDVASLPTGLSQAVVSRVKVLSRLKLDETRVPQDGRFQTVVFGRDIDFRVSTFPTPTGEKTAIRVLDPRTGLRGFDEIGLKEYHRRVLEEAIERPFGMILISGPTGSGKTTTLYAIMQRMNNEAVNILSLEDPVEYFMEGINQSQVRPEIGYDFASGLRQILRQDPDVIMVGEIRDGETAGLAVNAALTGHVMLSTIHTNNSIGVIPRLVDLGVKPFLLSSALNIMMAQRLVLKLCPECKKAIDAPPEARALIEEAMENLPQGLRKSIPFKAPYRVFRAEPKEDCKICKGKGTSGRIALFEFFRMTRELGDLINKGFTEGSLLDEAKRQGMVTLRQDGVLKALEGTIAIEEVVRETI